VPKIRVENGRIKLDEPTELPNGTELYVVAAEATRPNSRPVIASPVASPGGRGQ
jgi:hypothetical protein